MTTKRAPSAFFNAKWKNTEDLSVSSKELQAAGAEEVSPEVKAFIEGIINTPIPPRRRRQEMNR